MHITLERKFFAGRNKIAAKSSPDSVQLLNHRYARLIEQTKSCQLWPALHQSTQESPHTAWTDTHTVVWYSQQLIPRHLNCRVQIPNPSAMRNPSPPEKKTTQSRLQPNPKRQANPAEGGNPREFHKGGPKGDESTSSVREVELGNGKRDERKVTWHRCRFWCCAGPHDDTPSAVRHGEGLPCCKARYLLEPTARGDQIKKNSKEGKEPPPHTRARAWKRDAPSDRGGGDRRGGLRTRCPCLRRWAAGKVSRRAIALLGSAFDSIRRKELRGRFGDYLCKLAPRHSEWVRARHAWLRVTN